MKRVISIVLILISIFTLCSCGANTNKEIDGIVPPKNNNLEIRGKWEVVDSIIIDDMLVPSDLDLNKISDKVIIDFDKMLFLGKVYEGVSYRIKIVNENYNIAFDRKLKSLAIDIPAVGIDLYTVLYKNNILINFIMGKDNKAYIYYTGILFTLELKEDTGDFSNEFKTTETVKQNNKHDKYSEGLLLALKTPGSVTENGENIYESYRTLWISYKDGEIQPIEERSEIIFPRMNGMWKLEKKVAKNTKYHYEYYSSSPLESSDKEVQNDNLPKDIKGNLYTSINFIGNDYIATEYYDGNKFRHSYSRYRMLPIDNLSIKLNVVAQDIFSSSVNEIYKRDYEAVYNELDKEDKERLRKSFNYGSFTVRRKEGKWNLEGYIAPLSPDDKGIKYPIGISPNKRLINYDRLLIPWNTITNSISNVRDAFTSPEGNIGIFVVDNELKIYQLKNGRVLYDTEKNFTLNSGEEVIMIEWCTRDYVDQWEKIFTLNNN